MKNQNTELVVNRQTVLTSVTVKEGNTSFVITPTAKGVAVTSRNRTLNIPNGAVGRAIASELATMFGTATAPTATEAPKAKRTRRTKAQIEADNAAATAGATETSDESESTGDETPTAPAVDEDALNASIDAALASGE